MPNVHKFSNNRGGVRKGSGRKILTNKKIGTKIYLTPEQKSKIDALEIIDCKSFSKKCSFLIDRGLSYNNNDVEKSISTMPSNTKVKFIDLFAGIGGLRLGFEQALAEKGLTGESVFVSEIKRHAIEAYKKNFEEENLNGDITKINPKIIPDFDYLLAGFPCQAFSSAGNRLGFEDTRGTLFFDVAKILKEKQPKGFLLENVEGLVTHDKGKTFQIIINTLSELGYKVNYKILDSKDFNLAQSRKRIYIIGTKKEKPSLKNFQKKKAFLKDIIEDNVPAEKSVFSEKLLNHYKLSDLYGKQIKDKRGGINNIHSWDFDLKGTVTQDQKELLNALLKQRRNKKWASIIGIEWMDGMPLTENMINSFYTNKFLHSMLEDLVMKGYLVYEHPKKVDPNTNRRVYDESLEKGYNIVTGKLSFRFSKILDPNNVTPTLVATDVSKLAVPVSNGLRSLTIREGLRLFGFPDNYSLSNITIPKAFDLLGNTVCVPVVKSVSEKLLDIDYTNC